MPRTCGTASVYITIYPKPLGSSIQASTQTPLLIDSLKPTQRSSIPAITTIIEMTTSTTPRRNYHAPQSVRTPLRAVSPEEADSWSDGDSDATLSDPQPVDLDEPWPYTFRVSIPCVPR